MMHSAYIWDNRYPSRYGILAQYDVFRCPSCRKERYGAVNPERFFDAGVEEGKAAEIGESGFVSASEDGEDFLACRRLVFGVLGEVVYGC